MYLERISLSYYGPFYNEAILEIDENITVLTGSNDSGKTALLNAIEFALSNKPINEEKVNLDRIHSARTNWRKDSEILCKATFYINDKEGTQINNQLKLLRGDKLTIFFQFAPELFQRNRRDSLLLRNNKQIRQPLILPLRVPKVINLNSITEINTIIDLKSPNGSDSELLFLAFGPNSGDKLINLRPHIFRRELKKANDILNEKFSNLLPPSMEFKFELDKSSASPTELILNIQDKYQGYTPINLRGNGIKKIISIFSVLLKLDMDKGNYIFLYDEPENSLHADAQHLLRSFLENLSMKNNIQVIYATHSPSMINPLLPHTIRLIKREKNKEEIATSKIINKPLDDNFLPVRTSLGLTPVDSLLYAPISVIVEGLTEIIGLPIIFNRLIKEKISNFTELGFLLNQVRFLDGQGDSFEYWARLVKSQGCKPIIFVDGDKINRLKQLKIKEKLPDVPIIHFDENKEFENIVPPDFYFEALSKLNNFSFKYSDFQKWIKTQNFNNKMMFSKKVEKWIHENYPEYIYNKPRVMKIALQKIELKKLDLTKIFELVKEIKKQLLNFADNA